MKKDIIMTDMVVKETKIGVMRVANVNYISLTDLAKYQNSSDPSFTVKNWLRKVTTIDYVGLWEQIHNVDFN
ncbi:MAG: KilA-N domain-containing protein, partial [Bacteroidaceae bacterium]|nr:KilA-N domain-containing protein [Bacteroidaceae bacterium]